MQRRWRTSPGLWRRGVSVEVRTAPKGREEEAALWHERLTAAPSKKERARFECWRGAHRANAAAFERVVAARAAAAVWADAPEILALRQETLTRFVMPLRRPRWHMAVAASLIAAIVAPLSLSVGNGADVLGGLPTFAGAREESLHRTGAGERLTLTLTDGSKAILNANSRLRVSYTPAERQLDVDGGQVFFEVAKDPDRPFTVRAGDRSVTAHGTAFDVRMWGGAVQVALLEGIVTVARRGATGAPIRLKPNEVLTGSGATSRVRAADVERLTSWREGFVMFEDETVGEAVAEINRYTARPILLADEEVARLRISGAFRVGETASFIEAMEMGFGVRVVERKPDRVVLASGK